jgi:stage V sporulation protein B
VSIATPDGQPEATQTKPDPDVARTAGRGGLAVAFAKVYFIIMGLAQQIALPRVLGLDGYGALSTVLSIASIAYNPVTTTSIQGVSRAVTQGAPDTRAATIRRVFTVHALFAVVSAVAFYFFAPLVVDTLDAAHVMPAIRILSGVMLLYGLYTPLVGVLNGLKRFGTQAALDITAATLRTVGLIGGAWWFMRNSDRGVEGAATGFVGGAALIFLIALSRTGLGKRGAGGLSVGKHIAFILPILFGQILLNLLLQADLSLLRRFAADAARAGGLGAAAADPLVGAYRATQLFSFLPYQLLIAVTFILFPMLGTAARDGDRAAVARYVRTGVRVVLIIAGLMVSVTAGLSEALLELVFNAEVARLGGRSLTLLALGFGAFAIFGVLTTVLNSLKFELASAAATLIAVILVVASCFLRVRGAPFGEVLLWKTATATASGLFLATLLAAGLVRYAAGGVVALSSVVRVLVALAVGIAVGRYLPHSGKTMTIVYAGVVGLTYIVVLIAVRELTRVDLELVQRIVARRRAK